MQEQWERKAVLDLAPFPQATCFPPGSLFPSEAGSAAGKLQVKKDH